MLYRLPREDVSYGIVPPAAQPGEVCGGVFDRKWSIDEGHIVAVEEFVGNV